MPDEQAWSSRYTGPVTSIVDANKRAREWALAGRLYHPFAGKPGEPYCRTCAGGLEGIQHGEQGPESVPPHWQARVTYELRYPRGLRNVKAKTFATVSDPAEALQLLRQLRDTAAEHPLQDPGRWQVVKVTRTDPVVEELNW